MARRVGPIVDTFHLERVEVAHFFRIQELLSGRRYRRGDSATSGPTGELVSVDWDAAQPMRPDQRITDQPPGSRVRVLQESFNSDYCRLLGSLDVACNGRPDLLHDAVGAMYGLKTQAQALMQTPLGATGHTAGPTFEWVPPERRR